MVRLRTYKTAVTILILVGTFATLLLRSATPKTARIRKPVWHLPPELDIKAARDRMLALNITIPSLYAFYENAMTWKNYTKKAKTCSVDFQAVAEIEKDDIAESSTETSEPRSPLLEPCSMTFEKRIISYTKKDLKRPSSDLELLEPRLKPGGHFKPKCRRQPLTNVAIIIPFRDRYMHLDNFFAYMLPVWMQQGIEFRIILSEQLGSETFNKGRLMNAAVEYAIALNPDIDCFIFHDVDLLPQSNYQLYNCAKSPYHFAPFFDELNFTLYGEYLLGGASGVSKEHFLAANGWSNLFWGYGGEDDEFGFRMLLGLHMKINRAVTNITFGRPGQVPPGPLQYRHLMLSHTKRKYKRRLHYRLVDNLILTTEIRMPEDGYKQRFWRIDYYAVKPVYHHIFVDVGPVPRSWK